MDRYILRRLGQAALTILGVMLVTFLLFRVVRTDIASTILGEKATEKQRAEWRHSHGYDKPMLLNMHERLIIEDLTEGKKTLSAKDPPGSNSNAASALGLVLALKEERPSQAKGPVLVGRYVFNLTNDTPIAKLTDSKQLTNPPRPARPAASQSASQGTTTSSQPQSAPASVPAGAVASLPAKAGSDAAASEPSSSPSSQPTGAPTAEEEEEAEPPPPPAPPGATILFGTQDGTQFVVDINGVKTAGELVQRINDDPKARDKVRAWISKWSFGDLFDSQFCHHLKNSVTFQSRSLKGEQKKLIEIVRERGPASLSITVPAFAIEWLVAMVVSCFVAYYRGSAFDKIAVFLSVLGMCVPFLAFMMYGQWLMFKISPKHAYGTFYQANVYLPIAIMVVAGLGGQVRFYRTVILDEANRDYVRTARAKGLPLATILFKHVLKNCMLPILTSLVMSIPFLILGSLLVESYFGIPGLGDLMITSIQDGNEPIINGMVFLTAAIYVLSVLVTDICYAIFDPRIRLR